MQPYPPPAGALLDPMDRPPGPGLMPAAPWPSFSGKDVAIVGLSAFGVVLLLLSLASPWFHFSATMEDELGNTTNSIKQERLLSEGTSEEQSRVETATFFLVLTAISGGAALACLWGWVALRRSRAKQAVVLVLGVVPILFSILAPAFYFDQLPGAKLEEDRRCSVMWHGHFEPPTGASPFTSFYGSGNNVKYYYHRTTEPHADIASRASWGGSVGFYLPMAALFLFVAAQILMGATIVGAAGKPGNTSRGRFGIT